MRSTTELAVARRLLDQAFAPHAALARARQLRFGLPHRLVGLAKPRLADRQSIGRFLAIVLGLVDLAAQRHALGFDLGRLGGEFGDRRGDLLTPGIELDDLAVSIGQPVAPAGMILGDLAQALDPHGGFTCQAIAVALGFDQGRPQFGDARAQRARGDPVGLGVGDGRQAGLAEGAAHLGIGDVAHDLGHCLLDAAEPRPQLIGAARHVGMAVARFGGRALGGRDGLLRRAFGGTGRLACILRFTPRRVDHGALVRPGLLDGRPLGIARRGKRCRFRLDRALRGGVFGGEAIDLLAKLGQSVALAQPHGGRRRRAGPHRVAIPAPHRAIARDELLASLEALLQGSTHGLVGHDADEGEATREFGQRLDMIAERRGALRQRRCVGERAERQPVDGRAAIGRGFELVAERSTQRCLETRLDGERIEKRRPQRIGRRLQRRGDARFLGTELGEPGVDLLQALGRGGVACFDGLAIGRAGTFRLDALGVGLGHRLARSLGFMTLGLAGGIDRLLALLACVVERGTRGVKRGLDLSQCRQAGKLALDLALLDGDFLAARGEPAQALLELGDLAADAVAQRLVVGDLAGQPVVLGLGRMGLGLRRIARLGSGGGAIFLAHPLLFQPGALRVEFGGRSLGIALATALAGKILLGLLQTGLRLLLGLGDALGFGGQRIVRHAQPLQRGGRGGLVVAQRRQRRRGLGLRRGGKAHQARKIGDGRLGFLQALAGLGQLALRRGSLQRQHGGFGAADMVGEVAVATGLPRLALQPFVLLLERHQHVLHARQVLLGRAQPQLGLVAAGIEAGDAGSLVDDGAPIDRLGVDQGPDTALAHQGGRARPCRRIGKQRLHVAGTDLAAVHRIGRAVAALDAAHDVELVGVVHHGGRGARLVIERQRHLGNVARRPRAGAGEDHILHLAAAHLLGRRLAHHPLHGFDEVRLAAAVGADDAGHAGLDGELRRIDEGLEAGEPEFVELHHLHHAEGLLTSRACRTGRRVPRPTVHRDRVDR